MDSFYTFIGDLLKFFFLLTPFFVLSVFLAMTEDLTPGQRKLLAVRTIFAALCVCMILFFFGNLIFKLFGITLDSFRIGGGILLLLSAIKLVNGVSDVKTKQDERDISVVPLAIPITVGPGTTGAILVLGAETATWEKKFFSCASLVLALFLLGIVLLSASLIERFLKKRGIVILSKLTGLILAALAAQMIFTGIQGFLPAP